MSCWDFTSASVISEAVERGTGQNQMSVAELSKWSWRQKFPWWSVVKNQPAKQETPV